MKTVSTIIGDVKILDAEMVNASGYGQYAININIEFDGVNKTITARTTDSETFDLLSGFDGDKADWLLTNRKYLIEGAVEDYVNTL